LVHESASGATTSPTSLASSSGDEKSSDSVSPEDGKPAGPEDQKKKTEINLLGKFEFATTDSQVSASQVSASQTSASQVSASQVSASQVSASQVSADLDRDTDRPYEQRDGQPEVSVPPLDEASGSSDLVAEPEQRSSGDLGNVGIGRTQISAAAARSTDADADVGELADDGQLAGNDRVPDAAGIDFMKLHFGRKLFRYIFIFQLRTDHTFHPKQ
jgi:hypothetical protein